MSPDDHPSVSLTAEELLQQGIAAAREEQPREARRWLQQVLALDPLNEEAWLWLARIATDPRSALAYFTQVLDINPQNQRARDGFSTARAKLMEKDTPPPTLLASERKSTFSPSLAFANLSAFFKSNSSLDFGYQPTTIPTAVTLSSFAARSSAGGSVNPLWLGFVGVVLAVGSLFWAKRRVG